MDYPIWDIAMGGGVLMGIVAITHVIVSHFAIGGGLLIAVTETLAVRRNDSEMRDLAKRSSLVLILFSTVFGAISGVGIWVVAGLISPAAISALIRNFVWGWAIEWVFFIVEIVAALVYFATWNKISKRAHVMVIWIYFIAAYLSLVIINGIVTFMLTPGKWLQTGAFWDGFFNPTYFPSLLLRTGIAILMAVAFMVWPARKASAEALPRLNRYLGLWAVVGALISYAGYRWWESALPESTRDLFLGDGALLDGLAFTRHEVMWSVALFLVLSIIFLLALPKMAKVIPLLLITIAAFSFFGSYERLREGTRKPFIIHDYMFSNGVLVDEIGELNENGMLSKARWAARVPATNSVEMGRQVFDAQCRSCHTIDGYLSIRELAPEDPDMTYSILYALYDQGEMFTALEPGEAVAMGDLNYPFMPPFVGTEEEMEALVDFIASLTTPDGEAAAKGGV
ncbi:MAG: cytochrome ubiquinol oxidase subunit I [Thermoanaerobaculia bacterium]|jgi:mono/diheme cytochrome c family protein